jgi:hypothetical protein
MPFNVCDVGNANLLVPSGSQTPHPWSLRQPRGPQQRWSALLATGSRAGHKSQPGLDVQVAVAGGSGDDSYGMEGVTGIGI